MLKSMPEARQNLLIKCAEDVISICNAGVDPTDALVKAAADADLNEHEIDHVSHKVNQALTLAHLQTSSADDRGKAFPLTNAGEAKVKIFKQAPETSEADLAKGQCFEANTSKNMKAASDSYEDRGTYYQAPAADLVKIAKDVRQPAPELPSLAIRPNSSQAKIAYERAREDVCQAQLKLNSAITKAAHPFTLAGAPDYNLVAKVAMDMGCSEDIVGLVYKVGELKRCGQASYSPVKVASDAGVVEKAYARQLCAIEDLIKVAAEAVTKKASAEADYAAAKKQVAEWDAKRAGDEGGSFVKVEPHGFTEAATGIFDEAVGGHEKGPGGLLGDALGVRAGDSGPTEKMPKSLHEKDIEQGIRNTSARTVLQAALHDPYIGGHGVVRVADAINRANTLHPGMSEAALLSYVRQDLATEGGVPLDMQLRTIQAHKEKA